MAEKGTSIFTTGGTVQAGGGIYISRRADAELLDLCRQNTYAYVLTPRQMGKSSLMVRTAQQLKAEGICSVTIDLSSIGAGATVEEWYLGLFVEIEEQLALETDAMAWWQKYDKLAAPQRWKRFLKQVVLKESSTPVIIFVDEIDTTLNLAFSDDFFASIRAFHNARAKEPEFKRLSFVLIGVATPNDLINDALRTPFNIGQRVDLTDFTLEEALPLANGFDLPLDTAQRALSWVLKWTSGHPYLTQRLCKVLATTKRNTWTEADVDLLVQDTFIKEKSASDNNLQFVRDMLIRRLPDNNLAEEVLITYRDILCGKFVTDEERSLVKSHLKLSGVVTNKGGMLCVRNQIYREVFNDMWIGEHLAPISLHQIPSPPVDFTGREAELLALKEIMSGRGMGRCVLVGMGGVGKTALALKLAADLVNLYSDADLYLDLKGNDPQPLSVTTALQYLIRAFEPAAQLPDDVAQLQSIYRSVLHGKHALILLDNAKDAAQVAPLLPPTTCGVIITSRHSMHVAGLRSLLIDTLPPDAARAFLLKIAPHIGDSADEVARLLGYLPLALELAASAMIRSSDLTTQRLLLQLSKASGQVDLTLEASFQLSYDQLDSGAQARLRALSVFPTSFNDTAASVIWEIDVETAQDILSNLMAFSVVNFNPSTARYRMHDLVQSFVAARLSKEESHIVHERHARYFLTVLANANDLFIEGNEAMLRGLKLFDDERANIETGQSWAATNALSDSAAALLCLAYPNVGAYVLSIRQHLHESISWLKAALSASRFVENRVAENATLGNLGLAYSSVGETSRAIELFQKQLIIARELGDQRSEGAALGNLAIAYWSLGETRRAIDNYKCQIDISQEIGDQRSVGIAFGNLGLAYASIGEIQHAIELFQKQLMIARELGDRRSEGAALGNLGTTYASIGEIQHAIELFEQQLMIAHELGDRRSEGAALVSLGNAYSNLGDVSRAIELFEQQLMIARELGDRRSEGAALGNLGTAYAALNSMNEAKDFLGRSLAIARQFGDRRREGALIYNLSLVLEKQGDGLGAIAEAEIALQIFEELEDSNASIVRDQLTKWRA